MFRENNRSPESVDEWIRLIEDHCESKEYEKAGKCLRELLRLYSPKEIPDQLRETFVKLMLKKELWPEKPLTKKNIKNIHSAKEEMLDLILHLHVFGGWRNNEELGLRRQEEITNLKQIALWHALTSSTFLGSLFALPRGFFNVRPSLLNVSVKTRVAEELNKLIYPESKKYFSTHKKRKHEPEHNAAIIKDEDLKNALQKDHVLQTELRDLAEYQLTYRHLLHELYLQEVNDDRISSSSLEMRKF